MRQLAALLGLAWLATGTSALAQLSTEDARRLGLEVAWQSQVQMPRTKGLASAQLWAETARPRQLAVIEVNGRTLKIAADKLDRIGQPIGFDAAKLQAQQEAQFLSLDANADGVLSTSEAPSLGKAFNAIDRDQDGQISLAEQTRFIDWNSLIVSTLGKKDAARMLKEKGLEAAAQLLTTPTGFEIKEVNIPRIKLVLVSRNGSVETVDAETGKTLWANTCGDTKAPAFPGSISTAGVVVVQGQHLYVLDLETGKQTTTTPLQFASNNAVAATNSMAFVSDFSGRVEAYQIAETEFLQRWGYVIRGSAIGNTVNMLDKDLCGIASADGFLYIFNATRGPEVWMRYQSTTPIAGCIGTGNNGFYVGNTGGRLTKITIGERLGRTAWEFVSGQAFSTPPLIVGPHVYAATDDGALNCINDDHGTEAWMSNSLAIREPLAVAGKVVYSRSQSNEIVGLDIGTGQIVGRCFAKNLGKALMNQLTDRLYLIGEQGQLQCLRPIGADIPTLTTPVALQTKPSAEDALPPAENSNPTGEGSNPFDPNQPADPFPTADPFGGSGATEGAPVMDPFAPGN